MANHTSLQRMDEDLKKLLKRLYPTKTSNIETAGAPKPITKATKLLAMDLWDDVILGKRIKTKHKKRFKDET